MAKPAQWGVGALLIFSIGSDTPFYIGGSRLYHKQKYTFLKKKMFVNVFVKFSYPYFKVYSTRDLILREEHVQLLKKLIPAMSSKENEISQNHIYPDLQQGTRVT